MLRKPRVLERVFVGWGFWVVLGGVLQFLPLRFDLSLRKILILYRSAKGYGYFSAKIWPSLVSNFIISGGSPSSNSNPMQVASYDTNKIFIINARIVFSD